MPLTVTEAKVWVPQSGTRLLPVSWMPPATVLGVIYHWTAGGKKVNASELSHYHFIVEEVKPGVIRVHRGKYTVAHNDPKQYGRTSGRSNYAKHTAGANSYRVGIAVACMRGAREGGPYGDSPLTKPLAEALCQVGAEVLERYGKPFPVTYSTCLSHGEVERHLGAEQNGKWDINELPFLQEKDPIKAGRWLRTETNNASMKL